MAFKMFFRSVQFSALISTEIPNTDIKRVTKQLMYWHNNNQIVSAMIRPSTVPNGESPTDKSVVLINTGQDAEPVSLDGFEHICNQQPFIRTLRQKSFDHQPYEYAYLLSDDQPLDFFMKSDTNPNGAVNPVVIE